MCHIIEVLFSQMYVHSWTTSSIWAVCVENSWQPDRKLDHFGGRPRFLTRVLPINSHHETLNPKLHRKRPMSTAKANSKPPNWNRSLKKKPADTRACKKRRESHAKKTKKNSELQDLQVTQLQGEWKEFPKPRCMPRMREKHLAGDHWEYAGGLEFGVYISS